MSKYLFVIRSIRPYSVCVLVFSFHKSFVHASACRVHICWIRVHLNWLMYDFISNLCSIDVPIFGIFLLLTRNFEMCAAPMTAKEHWVTCSKWATTTIKSIFKRNMHVETCSSAQFRIHWLIDRNTVRFANWNTRKWWNLPDSISRRIDRVGCSSDFCIWCTSSSQLVPVPDRSVHPKTPYQRQFRYHPNCCSYRTKHVQLLAPQCPIIMCFFLDFAPFIFWFICLFFCLSLLLIHSKNRSRSSLHWNSCNPIRIHRFLPKRIPSPCHLYPDIDLQITKRINYIKKNQRRCESADTRNSSSSSRETCVRVAPRTTKMIMTRIAIYGRKPINLNTSRNVCFFHRESP